MKNANLNIEIYIEDNSENGNLLKKTRGYRRDVFVKWQDKFYKMNVFSFTYLNQFLKNQYALEKSYYIESNLLIVKNVDANEIIATILNQAGKHYFNELKECQIINGAIIYPLDELTKKSYKDANWPSSFPINELTRIY